VAISLLEEAHARPQRLTGLPCPAVTLLWALRLLLFLAVSPVALWIDSFFDSVACLLAAAADSFTHFFACRDGFTFHHFVPSLLAPLSDLLASTFKTPSDRFWSHSEFARSLVVKAARDRQILSLLILANARFGLGTCYPVYLPVVVASVAQVLLYRLDIGLGFSVVRLAPEQHRPACSQKDC
jgi:hypothetical protein